MFDLILASVYMISDFILHLIEIIFRLDIYISEVTINDIDSFIIVRDMQNLPIKRYEQDIDTIIKHCPELVKYKYI
jgi:hypothetical protein